MSNPTTTSTLLMLCLALPVGCDDGGSSTPSTTGAATTDPTSADGSTSGDAAPDDDPAAETSDGGSTTGGDDDPSTSGAAESSGGEEPPSAGPTVSGYVSRSVDIAGDNDGIGDIYLGLIVECADGATTVASITLSGADLSQPGALVPFTAENVPDGTYYLTGFFDDNVNTDPTDPRPDLNDLAAAENFGPKCTEVVVAGADVDNAVVTFNFVVPF